MKIAIVGIGGVGMSGLAEILQASGYQVSGSDLREDGVIVVTCEFCRAAYKFDDSDLAKIYAP